MSCYIEQILEFLKLHTNDLDYRFNKNDNKHVKLLL